MIQVSATFFPMSDNRRIVLYQTEVGERENTACNTVSINFLPTYTQHNYSVSKKYKIENSTRRAKRACHPVFVDLILIY